MSIGNPLVCILVLASQIFSPQVPDVVSVGLKPKTREAFERYVRSSEARIDKQRARPESFLYIDTIPVPKRSEVQAALKRGDIFMERLTTRDSSGGQIDAPGGLIHHWVGNVFIPGVSLGQVLNWVQDYDRHQNVYPEVVRSRLISRTGNDFRIALRFRYKKVITVTLNTEHDVRYTELDPTRWYSRSASTRIAELKLSLVFSTQPYGWRSNSRFRIRGHAHPINPETAALFLFCRAHAGIFVRAGPSPILPTPHQPSRRPSPAHGFIPDSGCRAP